MHTVSLIIFTVRKDCKLLKNSDNLIRSSKSSQYFKKIHCATVQILARNISVLNKSFIPICSLQTFPLLSYYQIYKEKGLLEKQRHRRRHQVKNMAIFNCSVTLRLVGTEKHLWGHGRDLRPSHDQRKWQVLQSSAPLESCQYQNHSKQEDTPEILKKKLKEENILTPSHAITLNTLKMKCAPNTEPRPHLLPQQEGKQPSVGIQTLCSSDKAHRNPALHKSPQGLGKKRVLWQENGLAKRKRETRERKGDRSTFHAPSEGMRELHLPDKPWP